jgi:hypothetical protein
MAPPPLNRMNKVVQEAKAGMLHDAKRMKIISTLW